MAANDDERWRGNEHTGHALRYGRSGATDWSRPDEPVSALRTAGDYPGWHDRRHHERRYGYGGETGRDTSWSGAWSSVYGRSSPRGIAGPDVGWGGDERLRKGRFAGRGPKGYHRSDTRIYEDVADNLSDAPDIDASEIEVTVSEGEVTLSGTVRTRYEKRRSEDVSERVSGVRDVHNNLRVHSTPEA